MELFASINDNKKCWLLPIISFLIIVGRKIVLAEYLLHGIFIYTIFRLFL